MSAEQTPDIAAVLAVLTEVQRGRCLNCLRMMATDDDWANTEEGERPDLCWENNVYSCGWVAETTLEALQAAALAPVLAAAVREAEQRALREFASVICDRNAEVGLSDTARHFGRTYANLARDRADRITDAPETCACPNAEVDRGRCVLCGKPFPVGGAV